jgi:hypothetical protein
MKCDCCAALQDSLLTSLFLLPVSAAAGLVIVKILRWRHRSGHMPPRSALQREAAYARILAKPSYERVAAWAVVGVILWMCAEGFLLLAPSSLPKKMAFDKPLEHVVVQTLVNFPQTRSKNQEKATEKTVQQSPCHKVLWRAGGNQVDEHLIVERCWRVAALDELMRLVFQDLHDASVGNTTKRDFSLWVILPSDQSPLEKLLLFKGSEEPIALQAYTTAWLVGADEFRHIRWPEKARVQMWQLVPFFERMFDELGCKESAK